MKRVRPEDHDNVFGQRHFQPPVLAPAPVNLPPNFEQLQDARGLTQFQAAQMPATPGFQWVVYVIESGLTPETGTFHYCILRFLKPRKWTLWRQCLTKIPFCPAKPHVLPDTMSGEKMFLVLKFIFFQSNKTGTRQCTWAVWSTFAAIHSTHWNNVQLEFVTHTSQHTRELPNLSCDCDLWMRLVFRLLLVLFRLVGASWPE